MKNVRNVLICSLLAIALAGCYLELNTKGSVVMEFQGTDDAAVAQAAALIVQPLKNDNANNGHGGGSGGGSDHGGGPPTTDEPTHARVYLFNGDVVYPIGLGGQDGEDVEDYQEVSLTDEQRASVVVEELEAGDAYTARVELGVYNDSDEFVPLLAGESSHFKVFPGRDTKVRINPQPVE